MNLFGLIKKMADSPVMVKCINYVRNVFAHIYLGVPLSRKKLGSSVNKVSSEYLVDDSLVISFVDMLKSVTEKTKCSKYEYSLSALFLKLLCNIDDRIAG